MGASEMTWIAPVYLRVLTDRAAANPEPPDDPKLVNEALQYAGRALDGEVPAPAVKPAPSLPAGDYGTVHVMGHEQRTGWVSDGSIAGAACLDVRDEMGQLIAKIPPHSVYMFEPLMPPRTAVPPGKPPAALPPGEAPDFAGTPYDEMDHGEYADDSRPF